MQLLYFIFNLFRWLHRYTKLNSVISQHEINNNNNNNNNNNK